MLKKVSSIAAVAFQNFFHFISNQFVSALVTVVIIAPFAIWIGSWITGPSSYKN